MVPYLEKMLKQDVSEVIVLILIVVDDGLVQWDLLTDDIATFES